MIKPGSIRFILALIVVIGHAAPAWIFLGHFAVICFFLLSGYWISNLFDRQYTALQQPVLVFYMSRIWRLLPMLLLFTALAGIAYYFFEPAIFKQIAQYSNHQKIGYWCAHFFMLGLAVHSPRLLAPAWSLDIELQFYLVFPLLHFLIARFKTRALILLSAGTVIITAAMSWRLQAGDYVLAHTICYYLVFFMTGMLIYYRSFVFSRRIELVCNLAFLFFVGLMYLEIISQGSRMANELLPLLLIPLLCNSVRLKSGNTDMFLGNVSYVLYLAHWPCFIVLNKYFRFSDRQLPASHRLLFLIIYLAVAGLISWLAYTCIDKKLNSARKKWVARQPVKHCLSK